MRLPEFDHKEMTWNVWQAFHVVHDRHTFVQFDTGEFVVCRSSWRPETRRVYKDLHLRIAGTDDAGCPRLFIPGRDKPVPRSHFNCAGMQMLLLDLDSKRVVSIDRPLTRDSAPLVPQRFTENDRRHVVAYYPGPESAPVGGAVRRRYPQPLTLSERAHIRELMDASKVWLAMQPAPSPRVLTLKLESLKVIDFVNVSFSALTTEHRRAIAQNGFDMTVEESHPFLTFDGE